MINKAGAQVITNLNKVNNMIDSFSKMDQEEAIKSINSNLNWVVEVLNKLELNNKTEIGRNIDSINEKFSLLQNSNLLFQNPSTVKKTENLIRQIIDLSKTTKSDNYSIEANKEHENKFKSQFEVSTGKISTENKSEQIKAKIDYENEKLQKITKLVKNSRVKLLTTLNTETTNVKKLLIKLHHSHKFDLLKDLGLAIGGASIMLAVIVPPVAIILAPIATLLLGTFFFNKIKLFNFFKNTDFNQLKISQPHMLKPINISFLEKRLTQSIFAKKVLEDPERLNDFLKKYPPKDINNLNEFYEFLLDKSNLKDTVEANLLENTSLDSNSIDIIMDYALKRKENNT